ncbi:hypothetical protein BH24ACT17_BH24ACT17_13680 [soil metagenome]
MPDTPQPAPRNTTGDPGSVVEFPGKPGRGRSPNNLPLQLTGLVGREREISEVEGLLAEARLRLALGGAAAGVPQGCGYWPRAGRRWACLARCCSPCLRSRCRTPAACRTSRA